MIKGYCREVCVGLGGRYRVLVSDVCGWARFCWTGWKRVYTGLKRLYCEAVL